MAENAHSLSFEIMLNPGTQINAKEKIISLISWTRVNCFILSNLFNTSFIKYFYLLISYKMKYYTKYNDVVKIVAFDPIPLRIRN